MKATAILPLCLGLGIASAAVLPAPEEVLASRDHEKLGDLISEWLEAKKEGEGISDARQELDEEIEKIVRRNREVEDLLVHVEDLEQCFLNAHQVEGRGLRKGRITEEEATFKNGAEFEYAVWAPSRYDARRNAYPLLLCIPEEGDQGSDHETPKAHIEQQWMNPDLREAMVIAAVGMPEDAEQWPVMGDDYRGGLAMTMYTLGTLLDTARIDPNRIYLSGRGQRGLTTAMAVANLFPDRFAGVIGRAGDMAEIDITNFRNLPTFFAGGGANCTAFQEATEAAEYGNCTISPQGSEADVWSWMEETVRTSNPHHVSFRPALTMSRKTHWIELDRYEPDGSATLQAEIDVDANRIEITAENIETIWVYFNDALVDLSQPVMVSCNGVEHEAQIPRNMNFMLDQFYKTGDARRLYVNRMRYELPAAESE